MSSSLPLWLLRNVQGALSVSDPRAHPVSEFDIISYTRSGHVDKYDPGISGVT